MKRVREVRVTMRYHVPALGAAFDDRDDAYTRLAENLVQVERGSLPTRSMLVERLARWLAWADSRETARRPVTPVQYEHRAFECQILASHGVCVHWRCKGDRGPWRCGKCEPHP